jgi:hypothetical protein
VPGLIEFLVFVVAPLACVASAALTPSQRFRAVGKSKALWVLLPFILGFLAAGYYFLFVRPVVRRG